MYHFILQTSAETLQLCVVPNYLKGERFHVEKICPDTVYSETKFPINMYKMLFYFGIVTFYNVFYTTDTQIPDAWSPGQVNSVQWHLTFST
jgi:hypothetical protein